MTAQRPTPYALNGDQFIDGTWHTGRSSARLDDRNPFNGETLLEMPLASVANLDAAYLAAEHTLVWPDGSSQPVGPVAAPIDSSLPMSLVELISARTTRAE